jgi:hypothetical protein
MSFSRNVAVAEQTVFVTTHTIFSMPFVNAKVDLTKEFDTDGEAHSVQLANDGDAARAVCE